MSDLTQAIVALVLALIVGAAGWFGRQQYGAERERRKQAQKEARDAQARADAAKEAPAERREAARILKHLSRARKWL